MIKRRLVMEFIIKRRKYTADLTHNDTNEKLHIQPLMIQTFLS